MTMPLTDENFERFEEWLRKELSRSFLYLSAARQALEESLALCEKEAKERFGQRDIEDNVSSELRSILYQIDKLMLRSNTTAD